MFKRRFVVILMYMIIPLHAIQHLVCVVVAVYMNTHTGIRACTSEYTPVLILNLKTFITIEFSDNEENEHIKRRIHQNTTQDA